jgi:hypothetical protein
MFETLEPPQQMLARRWPLLMYGAYCVAGLGLAVLSVRRHGFSQPVGLVTACAMFFLSLFCFSSTLRSAASLTKRKDLVQGVLLLLIMMLQVIVRL